MGNSSGSLAAVRVIAVAGAQLLATSPRGVAPLPGDDDAPQLTRRRPARHVVHPADPVRPGRTRHRVPGRVVRRRSRGGRRLAMGVMADPAASPPPSARPPRAPSSTRRRVPSQRGRSGATVSMSSTTPAGSFGSAPPLRWSTPQLLRNPTCCRLLRRAASANIPLIIRTNRRRPASSFGQRPPGLAAGARTVKLRTRHAAEDRPARGGPASRLRGLGGGPRELEGRLRHDDRLRLAGDPGPCGSPESGDRGGPTTVRPVPAADRLEAQPVVRIAIRGAPAARRPLPRRDARAGRTARRATLGALTRCRRLGIVPAIEPFAPAT